VGKQEGRQPDLVLGTIRLCWADCVDHGQLPLDGVRKPAGAIVCKCIAALFCEVITADCQVYRSQKICTAYRWWFTCAAPVETKA